MNRLAALCLASLALALPISAQESCSSLAITTVVDDVRPYQTVTVAVENSLPTLPVFLVVGPTLGKTSIDLRGLGAIVLDLDRPFTTHLVGTADAEGAVSRSVTVPSHLGLSLHAQAVSVTIRRNPSGKRMAQACTSNTVSFEL